MKLTGLTLYHFRNYEELHLALHPGVNLLVGENAQGKTNLLEAVFYLSTGGSFRTGRAQELIGFGAEFADLSCELFSGGREQSIRSRRSSRPTRSCRASARCSLRTGGRGSSTSAA